MGGERKIEKIRKGELCELMERKKWASNTGGKVKQSKDGKLQIPGQQNGLRFQQEAGCINILIMNYSYVNRSSFTYLQDYKVTLNWVKPAD